MFQITQGGQFAPEREKSYLAKKKQIHDTFRKKERTAIINALRKDSELPENLKQILLNFPTSINELMDKLGARQVLQWQPTITRYILNNNNFDNQLKNLFSGDSLPPNELIFLILLLLRESNKQIYIYENYFGCLLLNSKKWNYVDRIQLSRIFILMLNKDYYCVLKDAQQFYSHLHSNRFYLLQLQLYLIVLKKYSNQFQTFLPPTTLNMLSQHIQIHFYSQKQKIAMVQILIQVIFVSDQKYCISNYFSLQSIFDQLEYISFANPSKDKKKLINRLLLLVYNINFDITSKQFINHSNSLHIKIVSKQLHPKQTIQIIHKKLDHQWVNYIQILFIIILDKHSLIFLILMPLRYLLFSHSLSSSLVTIMM